MSTIDRRVNILNAAAKSFAQFGYKATTMEIVAKMACVGKGTIYSFFSTKDELFDEILQRALKELNDALEKGVRCEDTFSQNLFRILDLLMEFRSEHALFVKLAQEDRDVGTYQALAGIKRLENLVLDYIKRQLDEAIQKREIRPCNSGIVSFILLELYITLTMEWSKSHEPMDNEKVKEYIQLLLFKGLLGN